MKNPNSQIKENHSPFLKFLPGKWFPALFINNIEREEEKKAEDSGIQIELVIATKDPIDW